MSGEGRRPGRRSLSDGERTLWNEVIRSVRPLRRSKAKSVTPLKAKTAPAPKAEPPPRAGRPQPPATPSPDLKPRPKPAPGLSPIERREKKRLARGHDAIDGRLDRSERIEAAELGLELAPVSLQQLIVHLTGADLAGTTEEEAAA